jgi:hypothetical protein
MYIFIFLDASILMGNEGMCFIQLNGKTDKFMVLTGVVYNENYIATNVGLYVIIIIIIIISSSSSSSSSSSIYNPEGRGFKTC